MKLFKKLLYLIPLICATALVGCKNGSTIKIGILQIVEHESLDSVRKGFLDELKNLGYNNIDIDFQIAGGDLSNCSSIAEKFVNEQKDLILAISTPCAQAVANATKDIPILATAITDFKDAGIAETNEKPGTNVTGTSDLAPIEKIIKLIPKLSPDAKTIGVFYSNVESSPKYQAIKAKEEIENLGLTAKLVSVSQISEVKQVAENLAKEVDAVYIPIDKISSAAMPLISQIFLDQKKFVVCAEDTMISKGAIATYGMDYYVLGKLTAKQATEILENKNTPKNMPIEYLTDAKLKLNEEIIKKLNIKIPDELKGELK